MPLSTADLRAYAADLGLVYTDHGIRHLVRQHGEAGAQRWMADVAALIAYSELVWSEHAIGSGIGQPVASGLLRRARDFEDSKCHVDRMAAAALRRGAELLEAISAQMWADVMASEARGRHARLTATFEVLGGTLGRRAMLMLGMAADAGVPHRERERLRRQIDDLAAAEHHREFPRAADQDAARIVIKPGASLVQRIDPYAHHRRFREKIEDVLAELAELMAEHIQEGWTPDPTRAAEVDEKAWDRWQSELRRRAA